MKNYDKPTSRLIRMSHLRLKVGLCKASIYNRINAGTFPKPFSIGGKSVAWLESDIDQWIEQCRAAAHDDMA